MFEDYLVRQKMKLAVVAFIVFLWAIFSGGCDLVGRVRALFPPSTYTAQQAASGELLGGGYVKITGIGWDEPNAVWYTQGKEKQVKGLWIAVRVAAEPSTDPKAPLQPQPICAVIEDASARTPADVARLVAQDNVTGFVSDRQIANDPDLLRLAAGNSSKLVVIEIDDGSWLRPLWKFGLAILIGACTVFAFTRGGYA
jgi:hypothetical protein